MRDCMWLRHEDNTIKKHFSKMADVAKIFDFCKRCYYTLLLLFFTIMHYVTMCLTFLYFRIIIFPIFLFSLLLYLHRHLYHYYYTFIVITVCKHPYSMLLLPLPLLSSLLQFRLLRGVFVKNVALDSVVNVIWCQFKLKIFFFYFSLALHIYFVFNLLNVAECVKESVRTTGRIPLFSLLEYIS